MHTFHPLLWAVKQTKRRGLERCMMRKGDRCLGGKGKKKAFRGRGEEVGKNGKESQSCGGRTSKREESATSVAQNPQGR